MFIKYLMWGLLLGWGVAIPIGPMCLEVIRRNLRLGTLPAVSFGLGICAADVTYLVILSVGAIVIFQHPLLVRLISAIGALVLAWFGYSAFRMPIKEEEKLSLEASGVLWRESLQGYLLTLLSPFTIMFWASVSAQLALNFHHNHQSLLPTVIGVAFGTVSWIIIFNTFLHFTRHRLSANSKRYFNYIGGTILIGFAAVGLWHAVN